MKRSTLLGLVCLLGSLLISGRAFSQVNSTDEPSVNEPPPQQANPELEPTGVSVKPTIPVPPQKPAAPDAPPPAFGGPRDFRQTRVGGLFYSFEIYGNLGKNRVTWLYPESGPQENAPVLVPDSVIARRGDEEKIQECERVMAMVWAARMREVLYDKKGNIPPLSYDDILKKIPEFVVEMQLLCGNAARSREEQRKKPNYIPGKPESPCRSDNYLQLLKQILQRKPVFVSPKERKRLRKCSAWEILDEPLAN